MKKLTQVWVTTRTLGGRPEFQVRMIGPRGTGPLPDMLDEEVTSDACGEGHDAASALVMAEAMLARMEREERELRQQVGLDFDSQTSACDG